MARKTEEARENFVEASRVANQGSHINMSKGPIAADLQDANTRCAFIAAALASVADGLVDLADAIKNVYDKLEVIDRKVS
jgi:hypothetical protein